MGLRLIRKVAGPTGACPEDRAEGRLPPGGRRADKGTRTRNLQICPLWRVLAIKQAVRH